MTNISISQSGVPIEAKFQLGNLSPNPIEFEWENLRDSLSANNPDYVCLFDDFLLQSQTISQTYTLTASGSGTGAFMQPAISQLAPGEIYIRAGWAANGSSENGYIQLSTNTAWTVGNGEIVFKCRFRTGAPSPVTLQETKMEIGVSTSRAIATNGIHFEDHSEGGITPSDNIGSSHVVLIGGGDRDVGDNYAICTYNGSSATVSDTSLVFGTRGVHHTIEIRINVLGDVYVSVNDDEEFEVQSVFDIADKVTPYISVKNYDSLTAEPSVLLDYMYMSCPR